MTADATATLRACSNRLSRLTVSRRWAEPIRTAILQAQILVCHTLAQDALVPLDGSEIDDAVAWISGMEPAAATPDCVVALGAARWSCHAARAALDGDDQLLGVAGRQVADLTEAALSAPAQAVSA